MDCTVSDKTVIKFDRNNPDFRSLLGFYNTGLKSDIVPFWLTYAIDREYGGICTCISDSGEILCHDKYMWSQLRAIWTFSALYNYIDKNEEWLNVARDIFEFVRKYGRDNKGSWLYSTLRDGKSHTGATSIYSDGFAISGFTELARATGDKRAIDLAIETYENVKDRLEVPGSYQTEPLVIPQGWMAHGISMIFSKVFFDLGNFLDDNSIRENGLKHAEKVMTVFLSQEKQKLFEFARIDNTLDDSPPGKTVVPGHALESMWFMLHIYSQINDSSRINQAIECIRWSMEAGWDNDFDGLFFALDAEGSFWEKKWDTKIWWVHSEAIYALLLAYSICGEQWCLDWYEKVHNYTFSHYPVPVYGEWYQRLDRRGNHIGNISDLPVKDPYHVARAFINCIFCLEKITTMSNSDRRP